MRTRVCGACCTTGSARQPRSGKSLIATSRPTRGCREARPSTSRAGPSANQTGAPAHTFGHRLREALGLEELQLWYPSAAVPRRSSSLALLSARVGVIRSLPYRAQLVLEVPLNGPYRVSPPLAATGGAYVPDVRVWATWEDGVRPTQLSRLPGREPMHLHTGGVDWGPGPTARTAGLVCVLASEDSASAILGPMAGSPTLFRERCDEATHVGRVLPVRGEQAVSRMPLRRRP